MSEIDKKVKDVKISVEFEDGTSLDIENPKTMLLAYQNFNVRDVTTDFIENGSVDENRLKNSGAQIFGTKENLEFALSGIMSYYTEVFGIESFLKILRITSKITVEKTLEMVEKETADVKTMRTGTKLES